MPKAPEKDKTWGQLAREANNIDLDQFVMDRSRVEKAKRRREKGEGPQAARREPIKTQPRRADRLVKLEPLATNCNDEPVTLSPEAWAALKVCARAFGFHGDVNATSLSVQESHRLATALEKAVMQAHDVINLLRESRGGSVGWICNED